MLFEKIIICILTFIAFIVARVIYENNSHPTRASNIVAGIAGVLGITFCVLLITTNWNLFIIPKILLFISVCLYVLFCDECDSGKFCYPFGIGIVITVIAFIVTGYIYYHNIEECEIPEVSTTTCNILCAKDNSTIIGNISGSIFYIQGNVSEKSVYKYYYQIEDGGIKQGTIPANSTTIYFIKPSEAAYLETVVTTEYYINNNYTPATRDIKSSNTSYKLYVPEGSITNVYEFDAE